MEGTDPCTAVMVPPSHLNNNDNLPSDPPADKPIDQPTAQDANAPESTGASREIRKRGRRSQIPVDRKEEVAKLMADAAALGEKLSRKEAAKILYQSDKPTVSQRRNAGNIMKYYLKNRDKK